VVRSVNGKKAFARPLLSPVPIRPDAGLRVGGVPSKSVFTSALALASRMADVGADAIVVAGRMLEGRIAVHIVGSGNAGIGVCYVIIIPQRVIENKCLFRRYRAYQRSNRTQPDQTAIYGCFLPFCTTLRHFSQSVDKPYKITGTHSWGVS